MWMDKSKRYKDRSQAGEALSARLATYAGCEQALILALPRGGVPVALAVAKALKIPLDVLLVRKLGLPGNEEYAMGAIASGGVCVLRAEAMSAFDVPPATIEEIAQRELREIERRETLYRGARPAPRLRERVVILVDDGLATGSTMEVAVQVVRAANPLRLIVAVPVGSREACEKLQSQADEFICLHTPERFFSVGQWYDNFDQVSDSEVVAFLAEAERERELHATARQPREDS